ncbi:MAG: peptidase inhibitor family I36 protein [Acidobacteriota bacterium]
MKTKSNLKRNVCFSLIMALFISCLTVSTVGAAEIIIYNSLYFKGESVKLSANAADLSLPAINMNNRVVSIRIKSATSVALFSRANYEGICKTVKKDVENLMLTEVGMKGISSIKINATCPANQVFKVPHLILFEHNNYKGRQYKLKMNNADLSGQGNMNNMVSSIKIFNMNKASLYSEKNYGGKCQTIRTHIPVMANTMVKNDALSSVKFYTDCKQERFLKIRNNAAAIVKFSWITDDPLDSHKSFKLAVGQEKIINYKVNTKINMTVYYAYPVVGSIANAIVYKEKCNYSFKLKDNHFVVAKGTLLNPSCQNVVIPSF